MKPTLDFRTALPIYTTLIETLCDLAWPDTREVATTSAMPPAVARAYLFRMRRDNIVRLDAGPSRSRNRKLAWNLTDEFEAVWFSSRNLFEALSRTLYEDWRDSESVRKFVASGQAREEPTTRLANYSNPALRLDFTCELAGLTPADRVLFNLWRAY